MVLAAKNVLLVANTAQTVTGLAGYPAVRVAVTDTSWVRNDGGAATVRGDNCVMVTVSDDVEVNYNDALGVSVISAGTPSVCVSGCRCSEDAIL